ncbi:MAG TPA: polysaccharide lyase beta-sandwich domain-containing protein [Cyclobacteriaceae bacterium]|nr:polysaccharide lyase beta-sandwich domain-containing protein [Cyclobacteriaceae bacterium]
MLKVDEGCVLLLKKRPGQSPSIFVADPTQQLSQIVVEWEGDELGKRQWAVALPGGGLAGKSLQVE